MAGLKLGEAVVALALAVLARERRAVVTQHRIVQLALPPQPQLVLTLANLSSGERDLHALLLLVHRQLRRRASRLRLELSAAENGGFEFERGSGVDGQGRGRLSDFDGDLGGTGEGEGLEVGADGEVVVRRAVEKEVSPARRGRKARRMHSTLRLKRASS